jgi:hypothetical protein
MTPGANRKAPEAVFMECLGRYVVTTASIGSDSTQRRELNLDQTVPDRPPNCQHCRLNPELIQDPVAVAGCCLEANVELKGNLLGRQSFGHLTQNVDLAGSQSRLSWDSRRANPRLIGFNEGVCRVRTRHIVLLLL